MATAPLLCHSVEEFLSLDERVFDKRIEFHDGKVFELESATPNHSILCSTIGSLLRAVYPASASCLVFDGSVNVFLEPRGKVVKPDAAVVCGSIRTVAGIEGVGTAILNPNVIVEVLSKESATYDMGEKGDWYRSVASLEHYLLVFQSRMEVQRYTRLADTRWELSKFIGRGEEFLLGSGSIWLYDLYQGIQLDG